MTTPATIRRAGPDDVQPLATLFHLSYRNSSHPFQAVDDLARFLADSRNFAAVAEDNGRITASMAMTYCEWNDSYELGRALTHPEFRRHGLAATLMKQVIAWVDERRLGELFFGFPRARRIVDLCAALDPPMIVFGHDAGRNVANGVRETHLIVCCVPRHARFVHVMPAPGRTATSFLRNRIHHDPGRLVLWDVYPAEFVVGPVTPACSRFGMLLVDYGLRRTSGALDVVGCLSKGVTPDEIADEVDRLLLTHSDASHVTMTILADKVDLIRLLVFCGFEFTAYLPAWYKVGDRRYDCAQLVHRAYSGHALTGDLDGILSSLQPELMSLLVSEAEAASAELPTSS